MACRPSGRGEPGGIPADGLREGLQRLTANRHAQFIVFLHCELAASLASAGRPWEAIALLESYEQANPAPSTWCIPEFHRTRAEVALAVGEFERAERRLARARDLACKQGAVAWELRCVMTEVELQTILGRTQCPAHERLQILYDRYTDGMETPDLCRARELLAI